MTAGPLHYGTTVVNGAEPDDVALTSVTSILRSVNGGGDGLVWWARYGTAFIAVDRQEAWAQQTPPEAVKWLAQAHQREADTNRDTGSLVHAAIEQWTLTGSRPALVDLPRPEHADVERAEVYLDRFGSWLDLAQPDYQAAELVVYSPSRGYAGTADAFANVGGVPLLIDYKTHYEGYDRQGRPRRPYAEQVALQLVAYQRAEWAAVFRARRVEQTFSPRHYLLSAAERAHAMPVPEVDAGLCVYITPDHCLAYPIILDDRAWHAFLHAIDVYRWVALDSKAVMGPPLDLGGGHADHRPATAPA